MKIGARLSRVGTGFTKREERAGEEMRMHSCETPAPSK